MVKPTEARSRNHDRDRGRLWRDWPLLRRIPLQGIVDAVQMVVAHIIADQSAQMLLIQCDNMVQNLSAAGSHQTLRRAKITITSSQNPRLQNNRFRPGFRCRIHLFFTAGSRTASHMPSSNFFSCNGVQYCE